MSAPASEPWASDTADLHECRGEYPYMSHAGLEAALWLALAGIGVWVAGFCIVKAVWP